MLAVIRPTRIFSAGGFFVSAASFFFVLLSAMTCFPFLFGRLHCQPVTIRPREIRTGRKKTKRRGCARRGQPFFFLAPPARTSIRDGFDAGFTVRLGMNGYRRGRRQTLAIGNTPRKTARDNSRNPAQAR